MLTKVLGVSALAGGALASEATARANLQELRNYAAWYDSIAQASIPFAEGEAPACKTNWDTFIAARASYGCADSDSFDCSSVSDPTTTSACCKDGGTHLLTSEVSDVEDKCKSYNNNVDADETDDDDKCCKVCADPESALYPFTCTRAGYVGVSVCAKVGDVETPKSPLLAGYDCSTAPSHSVGGTYEHNDVVSPLTDCTHVDTDFAAGRAGSAVWADVWAAESNDVSTEYAKMRKAATFVERAVLGGGSFSFAQSTKCAVFLEPIVGEGSFFNTYDDSCGTYDPNGGCDYSVVPASVVTTADIRIYKPTVMASAATSTFSLGDVTVVGGSNAATLHMNSYGAVKLQGLVNSGTVLAWSAPNVFIGDTINSGGVVVDKSTTVLINITNSGQVNATGGSYTMYDIVNEVDGEVTLANSGTTAATVTMKNVANAGSVLFYDGIGSSTIDLSDVTNTGSVTMSGGTATGTAITNAGTVTIAAGDVNLVFTTNAGGNIVVAAGVTGTITLAEGGERGTTTFPASATGLTISGFSAPSPPDAPPPSPSSPVPSPPPPTDGAAPVVTPTVETSFTLSGDPSDYGAEEEAAIKTVVAEGAGVSVDAVTLTKASGSVVFIAIIACASSDAAAAAATALSQGVLANASALETALVAQFVEDALAVGSLSVAAVEAPSVVEPSPAPPPPPDPDSEDKPCFSRETLAINAFGDTVPMASLRSGDLIKDGPSSTTRVIVNQHRVVELSSAMVTIEHSSGTLTLTPDHVLEVDGAFVAARLVVAGSKLSGSEVFAVRAASEKIINPLTASGKLLTQGGVVASTYPEWVAEYMLSSYLVPLPLSLSNLISYAFPSTTQEYYDAVVEGFVTCNHPSHLKAALPETLVPVAFLLADAALALGFVAFIASSLASSMGALLLLTTVAASAAVRKATRK